MRKSWKQSKYPKGSRVRVFLLNKDEHNGILLTNFNENSYKNKTPEIQLENGKIVYGYECWWIPENEINL